MWRQCSLSVHSIGNTYGSHPRGRYRSDTHGQREGGCVCHGGGPERTPKNKINNGDVKS